MKHDDLTGVFRKNGKCFFQCHSVFRIFDAEDRGDNPDHDADLAPLFGCIDDETWEKAKSAQEDFKQP